MENSDKQLKPMLRFFMAISVSVASGPHTVFFRQDNRMLISSNYLLAKPNKMQQICTK